MPYRIEQVSLLEVDMIASEFAGILKALGGAYLEGGLRTTPPSLAVLIKDLQAFDTIPIADVKNALIEGRLPQKPKPTRLPKPKAQPNPELVHSYISRFRDAATDEQKFDEVLAELSADRSVRASLELVEILRIYSNGSLTAPKGPERLKLLRTAFHQRTRDAQTEEIAGNSSPF